MPLLDSTSKELKGNKGERDATKGPQQDWSSILTSKPLERL